MVTLAAVAAPFFGRASTDEPPKSTLVLGGLVFTSTGGNAADFTLWADHATIDMSSERLRLEQVGLRIRPQHGRPHVDLRCREGFLEVKTHSFRLQGDVRGRIGDGRTVQADWVAYDEIEGVLYSETSVLVEDQTSVYRGGGFRYLISEGALELFSGVQVLRSP